MAEYIELAFSESAMDLEEAIYDFIQERFPEWEPREGQLEVVLTEQFADLISQLKDLINDVPPSIFRFFGTLVNLPPNEALPATGSVTITVIDDAGYTIPSGTQMYFTVDEETRVGFETINEVVVPQGSTSTGVGEVSIRALEDGEDGNGFGPTDLPTLLDLLDFITGITVSTTTNNGQDEEADDAYLNRLSDRLQLLADRPVLAPDVEAYARTVLGVDRALAFDMYDPDTDTDGVERIVSVACINDTGQEVDSNVMSDVLARLESSRELTFLFKRVPVTITPVDVSVSVQAQPDQTDAALQEAVEAAINGFLDPSLWGTPEPGFGEVKTWQNEPVVRYLTLAQVVNSIEGVRYIVPDTLTLALGGGVQAPDDVNLPGKAPLPTPGVITVNVVSA